MTAEPSAVLENLLEVHHLGWVIGMYQPKDKDSTLRSLLEQLKATNDEFHRRLRFNISFTPEALLAESERNPHKVRAFLQALVETRNPQMLVMVWRILQGLRIHQVEMMYREQQQFRLVVVLVRPVVLPNDQAEHDEPYTSEDIQDAALVRHFGITTVNDKPVFDGFFPLPKT